MPTQENLQSNYTLLKLIRSSISPLSAMIGTSAYYGQYLKDPLLGSINALLFSKKLGIDIWDINQMPSTKKKILNSSKKILLGLGIIGLVNYAKMIKTNEIDPFPELTTINPWPQKKFYNDERLMDWDTYVSLNTYGISNLIGGLSELIPNRFEVIRKICNMVTGGGLISSGVAMGINNDFNNAYAIPTIVAGASEIIHNLLPMETTNNNQEMQETSFTDETRRLINSDVISNNSGSSDVLYERPTTYNSL